MINAVGREIPEEVLKATGKEPFKGVYAYDNYEYTKAAPTVRTLNDPTRSKLVENIHDALVKCGIKDGMVLSFHHHFREGDYVVNMVMEEVKSGFSMLLRFTRHGPGCTVGLIKLNPHSRISAYIPGNS